MKKSIQWIGGAVVGAGLSVGALTAAAPGDAVVEQVSDGVELSAQQESTLNGFFRSTYNVGADDVLGFSCSRNATEEGESKLVCTVRYLSTLSPRDLVDRSAEGKVIRVRGKVQADAD